MVAVTIKSAKEIEGMRIACRLAAETLSAVGKIIKPGISTEDIDAFVVADTKAKGAIAAPLGYKGSGNVPFPKSVCTSINEVICHGIPSKGVILQDGDIINVDITHIVDGFHGDNSATFYVGTPSDEAIHVTEVARRSLELGIAEVKPGARIGDIGAAIQEFAEGQNLSVVRQFTGHGIGRKFHEPPAILHFGERNKGRRIKAGMIFTIEPMINVGEWHAEILPDQWTAVTTDRKLSAQFEHTLLVTEDGVEVLTKRDGVLENSEIFSDWTPRKVES